jgi:DNA-binding transcriptional LysR family regulator
MTHEQLPYVETFAQAAELGSFTATARVLGLSQAAVSQRVQALEQFLNVPLFERQGGHVRLTTAGHRLHDYARRILALHREAIQDVTGRQAPLAGELSLASSSVPGEHLLPELLAGFRKRHPHVQVKATVADTQQVLHQVEHGEAHLGLVGGRLDNAHLEFRPFAADRLALVVPAGHEWCQRKRVGLEQLGTQPLIVREVGSGSRWCLEQALAGAGRSLSDLKVAFELGSNEGIKEAVQRGLGVTVLSTRVVQKEVQAGALHTLQVTGLPLEREMFVVWDRRRALPIPARLFLDLLTATPSGGADTAGADR